MAVMLDQGHHAAVLDTLMGAETLQSSKAVSHVLLRLADQQRYNVLADVRATLEPISAFPTTLPSAEIILQALQSHQRLSCLPNLTPEGVS